MSLLVQVLVVDKLRLVNNSLDRITHGDLDEKVNVYSSIEFASLSDDINQTVDALKGYIDAAEKKMEQELQMAHVIQNSALPKKFDFDNNSFELYATMDPAREVGGDFYDYFFVGKDKLALVIADVAGKGIPAALFMMRSKTALRGIAEEGKSISDVLSSVNNDLCEGNEASMFVTVWIAVVDLDTGDVRAANAGHEYPALMRSGGRYELVKDKHGMPLGAMEGLKFKEYELHLDPGDSLYVYTDGVPEAINTKDEQYGTDRMLRAINRHSGESMEAILRGAKRSMDRFVGKAEQFDDITMLGFRYNGKQLAEDPALEAMRRG
jgi:serine phosphatase RsbU (regulator of sigma subunit)